MAGGEVRCRARMDHGTPTLRMPRAPRRVRASLCRSGVSVSRAGRHPPQRRHENALCRCSRSRKRTPPTRGAAGAASRRSDRVSVVLGARCRLGPLRRANVGDSGRGGVDTLRREGLDLESAIQRPRTVSRVDRSGRRPARRSHHVPRGHARAGRRDTAATPDERSRFLQPGASGRGTPAGDLTSGRGR